MADTVIIAKNGSAVLAKILQRLARGSAETTKANQKSNLGSQINRLKRRIWYSAAADPGVDAASQDDFPVQKGTQLNCLIRTPK